MDRRVWLVGLLLYASGACLDFAYHLIADVRGGDQTIKYAELPVVYSAALFWPVDIVARALLNMR